jgi:hypothetical protein
VMEAVRRHDSAIAKMHAWMKWLLEDEPYRHAAEAVFRGTTLSWDRLCLKKAFCPKKPQLAQKFKLW